MVISQEILKVSYNDASAVSVLEKLESHFDVRFSYNAETVAKMKITIQQQGTLEEILKTLQTKTSLIFEKANDRYYIIRIKENDTGTLVCGYVRDHITLEPIANATIVNKTQYKGTTTNKQGYFELHFTEPSDILSISYVGYKAKLITARTLNTPRCSTIELDEDSFVLGEVLISDYITDGLSGRDKNGEIIVDPNKVEILPSLVEPDILETLQFLPGVQSPNETAAGIFIRGGTPDQNLILWDGIRMYSSGHFFDSFSVFNPYITEDMKLYRGGTKAKYGNLSSGVVDINSDSKIPNRLRGGFGTNLTNGDLFLKMPITDNIGVIVSGRRAFTDVYQSNIFEMYTQRAFQTIRAFDQPQETEEEETIFYYTDYTFKAIAQFNEKTKLRISGIYNYNKLDYSYNFDRDENRSSFNFNNTQSDFIEKENIGASFIWEHDWFRNFTYSIRGYYSDYLNDYSGDRESDFGGEVTTRSLSNQNTIMDYSGSITAHWKIYDQLSATFGYDYSSTDVSFFRRRNEQFTDSGKTTNISHSTHAELDWKIGRNIRTRLGVRGNHFSVTDTVTFIEPRLSLQYKINNQLKTRFSYEQKNQVLSQSKNILDIDFNLKNEDWLLADGSKSFPLFSEQYTAGGVYQHKSWNIDFDAYYRNVEGISTFSEGFDEEIFSELNGNSKTLGIDVLVKKSFNFYKTWVSYSYTQQEFQFDQLEEGVPFRGNFDIPVSFSWIHTFNWKNFDFSLGWNYRTGKPYTPILVFIDDNNELQQEIMPLNSGQLEDYHRLDCSASYKFKFSSNSRWKGRLAVSLLNLYNRKNELRRIAFTNRFSRVVINGEVMDQNFQFTTRSLGFTPNVSLRVNF